MQADDLKELLVQALAHERGGVKLYEAALGLAQNEDLRKEWQRYLSETRHHVEVLERTLPALGIDPAAPTPGSEIVARLGEALLRALRDAKQNAPPAVAEITACECVVLAETKDHLDWELIGEAAGKLEGEPRQALKAAYDEIEDQEDEHLYHTRGWCRELWLQALGMKAVLPPPEERRHVKTAIGAAIAEQSRRH